MHWSPAILLFSGHLGLLWQLSDRGVKLTTNLRLVQSLGTRGAVSPLLPRAFKLYLYFYAVT